MSLRPKRIQLKNEIGQLRSMPVSIKSYDKMGRGPEYLFMGLGPEPGNLPGYFPEVKSARYVECPEFLAQMDEEWFRSIPAHFKFMELDQLTPDLIRRATIIRYRENQRLFPSFWGPVRARCALPHLTGSPQSEESVVWLPGTEKDLLTRELEVAFKLEGFTPERFNPDNEQRPDKLPWMLTKQRPKLFFSVNFKGLESYGGLYHLLRHAGARVAVWCVDNPFHLLTGIKSNYWKELDIFVTDSWFIEPLKQLGATSVHHLPLAASPGLFTASGSKSEFTDLAGRLVFVGRSEFPQKAQFFSGLRMDESLWNMAQGQLAKGRRPDFGWWAKRMGVDTWWPGNAVRGVGFGAEETGRAWRTLCLEQAGEKLTVFGDPGWEKLLTGSTDLRGSVDYYNELPAVYRNAACVLNMTSPLLPSGLTQRHFDVWVAGGLLLTDDTPGLSIFPSELVREVTFSKPSEIQDLFKRYARSGTGAAVTIAWRECILAAHTYRHRIRFVKECLGL